MENNTSVILPDTSQAAFTRISDKFRIRLIVRPLETKKLELAETKVTAPATAYSNIWHPVSFYCFPFPPFLCHTPSHFSSLKIASGHHNEVLRETILPSAPGHNPRLYYYCMLATSYWLTTPPLASGQLLPLPPLWQRRHEGKEPA